jgi:Bacteriophage T4, Gp8
MSSILTINESTNMAASLVYEWVTNSNTYMGIGRVTPWSSNTVPAANNSVDSYNNIFSRLFALVKITGANMQLVVPRVDWANNVVYSQYDNRTDMYTYFDYEQANGTITTNTSNSAIIGTNTTFFLDYNVGDFIAYSDTANASYQIKEVVSIASNTSLSVNSKPSLTLSNVSSYNYNDTYPHFYNQFYVRNSYDQVYKCLFNNNGAPSTVMPQINLGGQLPSNPWIETSDGYKWKYLYTIPSGLKQKFFTNEWMPVVNDPTVQSYAVPGRIDIVDIVAGGNGYNSNVATSNANILTVTGDGTGANIVAVVNSTGTITDYNILNGGRNYTYANISVSLGSTGDGTANLYPIISPQGGHGSNSALELGASNMMLTVELNGSMGGEIPFNSSLSPDPLSYYQVSIIQNPILANTGQPADGPIYQTTSKVYISPLTPGYLFKIADIAYQSPTDLNSATFKGTVVNWDNLNNIVYLNNLVGSFTPYSSFTSTSLGRTITAFSLIPPPIKIYTGEILYVQNRTAVSRSELQTEQIKIVLEI